jgi:hypothetical protein
VLLSSNLTVSIMMSARAFQFRDDLPTSPGRRPGWGARKECALASHRLASLTTSVGLCWVTTPILKHAQCRGCVSILGQFV